MPISEMEMKRLVDLVDRGPRDDLFFPADAANTVFRRDWPAFHNAVPDIVELAYEGHAAWGQRITIPIKKQRTGDMLQWLALRLKPRSWLGPDLERKLASGEWDYQDPESAWIWAGSLGTAAVALVEFEINGVVIERWPGEWMDIWSRQWLEGGRAATWDADLYAQMPALELRSTTRSPWTTFRPTEDGYVYCWLPLTFLRRPSTAFPMISVGENTQVRVHITLRPFHDLVRRRQVPRTSPTEVPLGTTITLIDTTSSPPIPFDFRLPSRIPDMEDAVVLAGVTHLDEPLRSAYLHQPLEMVYEQVHHTVFDISEKQAGGSGTVKMQLPLRELNGPVREICWVLRRKHVWRFSEWTNYGALLEDALVTTIPAGTAGTNTAIPTQKPMLVNATLRVGTAVWRSDPEEWWRIEYGLAHRGGVRVANGMVYGYAFGEAEAIQPASTVNASRADLRLDLEIQPPEASAEACGDDTGSGWEVHVFARTVNWMRFVDGVVGPLFKD